MVVENDLGAFVWKASKKHEDNYREHASGQAEDVGLAFCPKGGDQGTTRGYDQSVYLCCEDLDRETILDDYEVRLGDIRPVNFDTRDQAMK